MSNSTRKPFHETAPARLANIAADLRAGGQRAVGCARALEEMLGHIVETATPDKHLPAMIEAIVPVETALRSKGFVPAANQVGTCLTELRRLVDETASPAIQVDRTLDALGANDGPHGQVTLGPHTVVQHEACAGAGQEIV